MSDTPWSNLRAHYAKNVGDIVPSLVGPWAPLAATYASTEVSLCSDEVEPARMLIHRYHGYGDDDHQRHVANRAKGTGLTIHHSLG